MTQVSNTEKIIDSRDVIERIKELQNELEDTPGDQLASEWKEEIAILEKLTEEAQQYCEDWGYGSTLIHKSYWVDYCKEMLEDIGDLPKDIPHYIVIDWEATANNIKVDYTEVDFNGETYYVR